MNMYIDILWAAQAERRRRQEEARRQAFGEKGPVTDSSGQSPRGQESSPTT